MAIFLIETGCGGASLGERISEDMQISFHDISSRERITFTGVNMHE